MNTTTRMVCPAIVALMACQSVPSTAPSTDPLPVTPAADAGAVLDRLEAQGKSMTDFAASVTVEKFEALTEEREIRRGRVAVEGAVGPARRIGVVVDEVIDATGRGSPDGRRFVFAEGWLCEFDATMKQCIRRQIAREGEAVDPLRVGDGPFPVPLGQPKAEVVKEFSVTMAPLPDAAFLKSLAARADSLVTLRLVPRAGTPMARETGALLLVLERESLAPAAVVVEQVNGDRTAVVFRGAKIDAGLDPAFRELLTSPDTTDWKTDVRPLS